VLVADGERLERLQPHLDGLVLDGLVVVGDTVPGAMPFAELVESVSETGELPIVHVTPDDPATILYTSGTTGRPKGALGTHRNICNTIWGVAFVQAWGRVVKGGPAVDEAAKKKAALVTGPMFHVIGCFSMLAVHSFAGNKLVLMRRWNAEHALDLVEGEGITHVGGVPAVIRQLVDTQRAAPRDVSSLERFNYGGSPAPPELAVALSETFPRTIHTVGYGMTETSSPVSMNFGDYLRRKPESVGPPFPVCECRVVDDTGEDVPVDETGELWIRGPNVVTEYWERPEATAETFTEGWLKTGDIARVDEDGFIYIVDRIKDMVIRGGENVYCIEVENALFEHPDVIEAAVIGLPHEVLGEEVGAVVQVRYGATVSEEMLQSHLAARLARFKIPVRIDVRRSELPRNAVGKVMKTVLRDELTA
jgi:long-chain acyl-CoA synthetase